MCHIIYYVKKVDGHYLNKMMINRNDDYKLFSSSPQVVSLLDFSEFQCAFISVDLVLTNTSIFKALA